MMTAELFTSWRNSAGLDLSQCLMLACQWEVSATKVGNVHRGADFADMTLVDFLQSSVAAAPCLARAGYSGVGTAIRQAIQATRRVTLVNTNLGICLLLAPLAAVPPYQDLEAGIANVLAQLGPADSQAVYAAIAEANPGGLGEVGEHDVRRDPPPASLLVAMQLAADHDLIARQYVNGFQEVLCQVSDSLRSALADSWPLNTAILAAQLQLMHEYPDSLIARKAGQQVAQEAADRAGWVLEIDDYHSEAFHDRLSDLDFWLRSDGNRRNPGTTADLITAGLFAGLRSGWLNLPIAWS